MGNMNEPSFVLPVGAIIKVSMMASMKLVLMSLATISLGVVTTGCASSNVTKTVQGAPIQYKVGDGPAKYASLSTPRSSVSNGISDSYIPARPMPARPAPRAAVPQPTPVPHVSRPATPSFDPSTVDQDLYKHQRVGNQYTIMGKSYTPKHEPNYDVTGTASWYGPKFNGKPTATGEIYDMYDLTAAHKTLPLNSMLFVTNIENGKSIMVRLNDRGPFVGDRIIDLSKASADALGIAGLGEVRVQYAGPADPMAANRAPVKPPVEVARPVLEDYVEAPAPAPTPAPVVPYTAPTPAPVVPYTAAPTPAPYTPPAPVAPTAPESLGSPNDVPDGQVTLTIKGPIHVAKHEGGKSFIVRERLEVK